MAEYDRIAHLEEQLALALRTVDRFADTITQQKSALTQSQAELAEARRLLDEAEQAIGLGKLHIKADRPTRALECLQAYKGTTHE